MSYKAAGAVQTYQDFHTLEEFNTLCFGIPLRILALFEDIWDMFESILETVLICLGKFGKRSELVAICLTCFGFV